MTTVCIYSYSSLLNVSHILRYMLNKLAETSVVSHCSYSLVPNSETIAKV